MQKFLVLYRTPVETLEDWMKTDEAARKAEEEKMQQAWDEWAKKYAAMLTGMTAGVGKPKRINSTGTTDTRNDIMLCSIVEAATHEDAAKIFEDHPHLQIPNASIEVMPLDILPGEEGAQQ